MLVVRAVGEHGVSEARKELIDLMGHPSPEVAVAAVHALTRVGLGEDVAQLAASLDKRKGKADMAFRMQVLDALASTQNEKALEAILRFAGGSDAEMRAVAMGSLATARVERGELERLELAGWHIARGVAEHAPRLVDLAVAAEVQRLVAAGQPAEQAWAQALARLGAPGPVAAEFAKVPAQARWLPATVALFTPAVVAVGVAVLLGVKAAGGMEMLLATHVFLVTVGYCTGFVLGLLALWAVVSRLVWGWPAARGACRRPTPATWRS